MGRAELRATLSAALRLLGTRRSAVVCGTDGLDEVTLNGPTNVSLIEDDSTQDFTWAPPQFGLQVTSLESLLVDDPDASAAMIRSILSGTRGAPRDIVVLNSAAALWVAHRTGDVAEGAALAAEAIDSGAAQRLLERLAEVSRAC